MKNCERVFTQRHSAATPQPKAKQTFHHEGRRVERRRAAVQVSDFQCIRPFGLWGKWPPDHQHVSSSLSKIPYGGFSPVRLQTGIQPRPSSKMSRLSARPAFTQTPWTYTRLQSLSPKRAFIRRGTFVQAELPLSYPNSGVLSIGLTLNSEITVSIIRVTIRNGSAREDGGDLCAGL